MTDAPDRGEILRPVPADAATATRMGRFATAALGPGDYHALHRWSVDDPEAFWRALIAFFDLDVADLTTVLADAAMPGARWLPGARMSYSAHALREEWTGPAVVGLSQARGRVELSFDELRDQVARARAGLVRLGVEAGDRVAGYLPHVPETIVAFLAAASLGAVWVSCPPEFGPRAVVDRLGQVAPTVLVAVDGTRWGERAIDRSAQLAEIRDALPSLRATVFLPYLDPDAATPPGATTWTELLAEPGPLEHAPVGVRPPALRAVLLGHDGPAQADRARARRHPARAPQGRRAAQRRPARRPVLLVLDHRLDHVELRRLRAARRAPPSSASTATRPGRTPTRCGRWPRPNGSRSSAPRRRSS